MAVTLHTYFVVGSLLCKSAIRAGLRQVKSWSMMAGFSTFCLLLSIKIKLRPVLLVVQVMSDISKQACIRNKRIPQRSKMRICIHYQ